MELTKKFPELKRLSSEGGIHITIVVIPRLELLKSESTFLDMNDLIDLRIGDARTALKDLPDKSVQTCITSPPYFGLRDYGHDAQIGLEPTLENYIEEILKVTQEIWRVLKDDGTFWLNIGDSYSSGWRLTTPNDSLRINAVDTVRPPVMDGVKPKDLIGIPFKLAFALRDAGWYFRSDIVWHKPQVMPESVKDRPTKSHEYIFLFSKGEHYKYNPDAIAETAPSGVRNRRSVWTMNPQGYEGAHFATFPEKLPRLCILASTDAGDTVIDPFAGSGTTGKVAIELGRKAILCELNPDYRKLIEKRTTTTRGFAI